MKKANYQKPSSSVISLGASDPFLQGSAGQSSTPDIDLSDSKDETPESADSKGYDVWDREW